MLCTSRYLPWTVDSVSFLQKKLDFVFRLYKQCFNYYIVILSVFGVIEQEGQHPLTGQRAANFRLLANQ